MSKNAESLSSKTGAFFVAAGILLSRISGLIRQRVFAHFFGNSDAGDAFYAALKIPNFLQNLFGEGVLSASFIPVYANLVAKNDHEKAGKVAGIIFSILSLLMSVLTVLGIYLTPYLIDLVAPGFSGEKRSLTILLVQIIFPGTGLLVLSAWCLGILNSHHRFFLSYAAPVLWNGAIIVALIWHGPISNQSRLAVYASWGLVAGSLLQFMIQLPGALRLIPSLKLGLSLRFEPVWIILINFIPVVIARGVVQVSAYIDNILASYLPGGAVSALSYAQAIYMLPISLFGLSMSAAELPVMAGVHGLENQAEFFQKRINNGLRQIAFFVVPSIVGFLFLGDVIVSALYQSGEFGAESTRYVWAVLAGYAVGLFATTLGRLYSSAYYSLRDTKTPLRFALIRVFLATVLGYYLGLKLPAWFGISASWGAAGITVSAGIAAWLEYFLLQRGLNSKIGKTGLASSFLIKLWASSLLCGALGWGLKLISPANPILRAGGVIGGFGILYFLITSLWGIEESKRWTRRLMKFRR